MIQNVFNFNYIRNNCFHETFSHNKYDNQQVWHYNNMYDDVSFKGKNKNMQTNPSDIERKVTNIGYAFSQKDIKIIASAINKMSFYDYDTLMRKLKTYKYCGDSEASLGYNFDSNGAVTSVSIINSNNKTTEAEICVVQIEDFSKILLLLKEYCSQKY